MLSRARKRKQNSTLVYKTLLKWKEAEEFRDNLISKAWAGSTVKVETKEEKSEDEESRADAEEREKGPGYKLNPEEAAENIKLGKQVLEEVIKVRLHIKRSGKNYK